MTTVDKQSEARMLAASAIWNKAPLATRKACGTEAVALRFAMEQARKGGRIMTKDRLNQLRERSSKKLASVLTAEELGELLNMIDDLDKLVLLQLKHNMKEK